MIRVFKIVLPILILALGFGAFQLLASMREPPQRVSRSYAGPLVEAVAAPLQQVQVVVEGQGTVRPDAQIDLVPQVSGIVVWKDADFKPGGTFAKGALLFRIDPRDYELAVQQAEVQVAQARYQLDLAREEAPPLPRRSGSGCTPKKLPPTWYCANLSYARPRLVSKERKRASPKRGCASTAPTCMLLLPVGCALRASMSASTSTPANPSPRLYSIEKAEIVVPVPDEDLGWFTLPLPIDMSLSD